jgi:hypothetical protein
MKNEALKNLIREEIKNVLSMDQPIKTGAELAKDLRRTSIELTKDTAGISSAEAPAVKALIDNILSKAKGGNLNAFTINRLNDILNQVQTK